jgi:hypothetical protein
VRNSTARPTTSLICIAGALAIAAACEQAVPAANTSRAAQVADGPMALRNGEYHVALLGDTTPGLITVTWRGNYNAHGFSVVTFAVRSLSDLGDSIPIWQNVPFFGGPHDGDSGREDFLTSEGADCTLGDLRVVRHEHAPVEIVIASREIGRSFADAAPVRFDYYEVAHNRDGVPGWPPTYFKFDHSLAAKRAYCDVNQAFNQELHLGSAGIGRGEGGR